MIPARSRTLYAVVSAADLPVARERNSAAARRDPQSSGCDRLPFIPVILLVDPKKIQHERILQCGQLLTFEPSRLAGMSGTHVHLEQDRVVARVVFAHLRHPLGGREVRHLRVMQSAGREDRRDSVASFTLS